ncbi:hypothetical protein QUA03_27760 [Microcoleus sp. S36b_A4]|uniref:hypothetical protein n=1 Tax=Microcoleus sp. S36b_A4 TaxID=3055420 RepID=UPI002FD53FBA
MKNSLSQTLILDTVSLIVVFGSLWLAVIDPSTRSAFGNLKTRAHPQPEAQGACDQRL